MAEKPKGATAPEKPQRRRRTKAALAAFRTLGGTVVVVDLKSGSTEPVYTTKSESDDSVQEVMAEAFIAGARWAGGAA